MDCYFTYLSGPYLLELCDTTLSLHITILSLWYYDIIVMVSRYTLGIDTSNEHMLYDNQVIEHLKYGIFYVKM